MSLLGRTFVTTKKGVRWVSTMAEGDWIWGLTSFRKIKSVGPVGEKKVVCVEFSDGRTLNGTLDQEVWVILSGDKPDPPRPWTPLQDLKMGDRVRTADGIAKVEKVGLETFHIETVYNLVVDGGMYFADGVLVNSRSSL